MMKVLSLLIFGAALLIAAPAFHEKKEFELSNRDSFEGYLKGDEHLNWIESEDGDILLFNTKSNRYEYAQIKDDELIPSGIEKQNSPLQKRLDSHLLKTEVLKLWKRKRQQEFKRRKAENQ